MKKPKKQKQHSHVEAHYFLGPESIDPEKLLEAILDSEYVQPGSDRGTSCLLHIAELHHDFIVWINESGDLVAAAKMTDGREEDGVDLDDFIFERTCVEAFFKKFSEGFGEEIEVETFLCSAGCDGAGCTVAMKPPLGYRYPSPQESRSADV